MNILKTYAFLFAILSFHAYAENSSWCSNDAHYNITVVDYYQEKSFSGDDFMEMTFLSSNVASNEIEKLILGASLFHMQAKFGNFNTDLDLFPINIYFNTFNVHRVNNHESFFDFQIYNFLYIKSFLLNLNLQDSGMSYKPYALAGTEFGFSPIIPLLLGAGADYKIDSDIKNATECYRDKLKFKLFIRFGILTDCMI